MTDSRAGKTFHLNWPEWVQFCAEQDIDPIENREFGFDLGGGDSYDVVCCDQPDEVEHLDEQQERENEFSQQRWR